MCDCRKCPYRGEFYAKDCWQTYIGCSREWDGWDHAECNTDAPYCVFNADNKEELIQQGIQQQKQEEIDRLKIDIEYKEDEIKRLQEEIDEIYEEIEKIKLDGYTL